MTFKKAKTIKLLPEIKELVMVIEMTKELKVPAIKEGTVIDHIPSRVTFKVMRILALKEFKHVVSVVINLRSKTLGKKGIIKIGGRFLTKEEVDKIAILAPNATVNIIKDYEVKEKIKVQPPSDLLNILWLGTVTFSISKHRV